MLNWMQSFGEVKRIGIECTGTYGAGLLRYLQQFDVEILEVTSPDKMDRRRRGKNDTIDAENAAHAAFAGMRTVTPKTRDGMVESLRVLKVCRKTAIAARRIALQMIRKANRHRLNRGGDRAANSALHIIAIGRLRTDNKTKEYVDKRLTQGHTKLEALRCLKRYIAREVYYILKKRNNLINSIQIAA
jgi:transposase